MSNLANDIARAIRDHQPLPAFPESLSLAEGYALQLEVANLVATEGFAGIKAGVTSSQLQTVFGVTHALLGRLYKHGHLKSGATLNFVDGQLIECEIGIVVDSKGRPVSAGLAIEFAFAAFASPGDAKAPNLVAGNVAADKFLTGQQLPWRETFDDITARFYHNDELVNEASAAESLGGPENAASWMVEEAKRYNIDIPDNTLLMTGACGKVLPAMPGHYRADYGELGEVTFTISP